MFVRGGVYVVVRDSMGPMAAQDLGFRAGVRLRSDGTHQLRQRGPVLRAAD